VPVWIRPEAAFDRLLIRAAPVAAVALRLSLGLIFLWFGALKLAGDSPVAALVSATLPWGNPDVVVPLLGAVEVGLGIGLLVGRARRLLLLALAAHLAGTFLTFLMAPGLTMQNGNPLLLTADGEFVLKNAVLISAAVLLACTTPTVTEESPERRSGMPLTAHSDRDVTSPADRETQPILDSVTRTPGLSIAPAESNSARSITLAGS
jgi:uncharacterized membrane protein YphA (DoxX/SURF4 family)